tara:strand:- start:1142 stop:1297 length:156 start_codon:yes stop_codon:yes gene_type:complete
MLNSKEAQQTVNFIQSIKDLENVELKNNFEKLTSNSKKTLKRIVQKIDAIK